MSAAEMVHALRTELLLRCGSCDDESNFGCKACEERQPCIHYDTASLPAIIAALEDVARAVQELEAIPVGKQRGSKWQRLNLALTQLKEEGWEG